MKVRLTSLWYMAAALLTTAVMACSNHKSQYSNLDFPTYQSPIDSAITLAGNFGEPRPWHFHGGLDIRTNNQEGWNIRAIADGYVSRLTVGYYGFGNAIYVNHPDGHTSVYCHLQRFADSYEQLLHRTGHDTLSLQFDAGQYPVRSGDLIAISGNTGHSTGPHLHLEIHDTETWVMRDPMAFIGHLIADTVAPQAHSLMAVPQPCEGVFNGSSLKQTFAVGQSRRKVQTADVTLPHSFTAWGRVGFALCAADYSETAPNYYGVRHILLLVDGREVFRSDVDSIPASCQPEVNVWGDYDYWRHHRRWFLKSYRERDTRLPVLHTGFDRGIVTFDEERDYELTYVLSDYFGNTSRYRFTVRGRRDATVGMRRPRHTLQLLDLYRLYGQCLWPLHTLKP